jgi:hypothetical protein
MTGLLLRRPNYRICGTSGCKRLKRAFRPCFVRRSDRVFFLVLSFPVSPCCAVLSPSPGTRLSGALPWVRLEPAKTTLRRRSNASVCRLGSSTSASGVDGAKIDRHLPWINWARRLDWLFLGHILAPASPPHPLLRGCVGRPSNSWILPLIWTPGPPSAHASAKAMPAPRTGDSRALQHLVFLLFPDPSMKLIGSPSLRSVRSWESAVNSAYSH